MQIWRNSILKNSFRHFTILDMQRPQMDQIESLVTNGSMRNLGVEPSLIQDKRIMQRSCVRSGSILEREWCGCLDSCVASDVENWKGPWANYEGEEEDRMTSEEKGEMTDWQRVWLERNKNKKVREVVFFSSLHS